MNICSPSLSAYRSSSLALKGLMLPEAELRAVGSAPKFGGAQTMTPCATAFSSEGMHELSIGSDSDLVTSR